jgi:HK97 family phage major capsid protein
MSTYKEYIEEAKGMFDQAKALAAKDILTSEEDTTINQLVTDGKALQAKALRLEDIERLADTALAKTVQEQPEDTSKWKRKDPTAFKDWAEYLHAAWWADHPKNRSGHDPRLQIFDPADEKEESGHGKKDLAGNVGASGGFLIPGEFMAQLQAVIGETSIVQPRATVIRMRRRSISLPVLLQTATTANTPHWFGGIEFTYGEENEEKHESDPAFGAVTLSAKKLFGYTRSSDELVEDSAISLADFLSGPLGFAGGVAWWRDYQFLRGVGGGFPLGVINANATLHVHRNAQPNVQYVDLVAMMEAFLPSGRGVWVANQTTMSNFLTMVDPLGGYIWHPNYSSGGIAGAIPGTIFGMPIIFTEKLPTIGNAGDVLLADFRYYLVGDRQAATVESTKFDRWRYDQTSWRVVDRHDGQPWLSAPLTLQDGTAQVSPFVILESKTT